MTSIALAFNPNCIAIAADSAASVLKGQKIFNANKIFHISDKLPIGIAIFNNAAFCGLGRETIIKEFRKQVKTEFISVKAAEESFIKYLENNEYLIGAIDDSQLVHHFIDTFLNWFNQRLEDDTNLMSSMKDKENEEILEEGINYLQKFIDKNPLEELKGVKFKAQNETLSDQIIKENIRIKFPGIPQNIENKLFVLIKNMMNKAVLTGNSGIVFFGYGKKDICPAYCEMQIYTKANGSLIYYHNSLNQHTGSSIDQTSGIATFAQGETIGNILTGAGDTFCKGLSKKINDNLTKMEETTIINKGIATNISTMIESVIYEERQMYRNQFSTLVSALGLDEIGKMVETLVNLEAFKKRVSLEAETVGGLTDVAIITKGDGFIRLKRKHYFEPHLNPQYFTKYHK